MDVRWLIIGVAVTPLACVYLGAAGVALITKDKDQRETALAILRLHPFNRRGTHG